MITLFSGPKQHLPKHMQHSVSLIWFYNNLARRPRHISWLYILFLFYIPGPSLKDSLQKPQVAVSGSNILLTCVVRDLGNHTLLWKYGVSKVLTAGTVRITSDSRYSVLHDKGKFLNSLEQFRLTNLTHNIWEIQTWFTNSKWNMYLKFIFLA